MTIKDEFCEYIRLNEKSMYYLAYSIVHNEHDANEIISESIYRAYKAFPTLKNKNAFKPWILRIVHNTANEILRKDARIIHLDHVEEIAIEETKNETNTKAIVTEAIKKLKQPYQTVTILYYYEDLSIRQIAHVTHTNILTVRQQLSRSRKMLSALLKEDLIYE